MPEGPEVRRQADRLAKARFADGHTLCVHHQLYGRWSMARAGSKAEGTRTLRAALRTDTIGALLWSATDVHVLDDADLAAHPYLRKLGPDVLDATTTSDLVLARLGDARFARRSLAGLYLDQGFLAGIGNYLRTETLWYAGVDPEARPVDLAPAELAGRRVYVCARQRAERR